MLKRIRKPDLILSLIIFLLIFAGILILGSVSASFSQQKTGSTFFFLSHQLLYGLLPGLFLGTILFFTPLRFIQKASIFVMFFSIILLAMVFLPVIGTTSGGAARWIYAGSFSFQPSELLKPAFILYLASWLASRTKKTEKGLGATLIPFGVIMGVISLLLILQPDIGTLGLIGIIALFIYFAAPTPIWHILLMITLGITGLFALIKIAPYRASRIAVFLNPNLDPLGQGYQIKQALIGIGSGGLTGIGLGLSVQKFGFLPQPISDSIFAVFAEETGFIGAFILLLLFLAFAWRGLWIARQIKDTFSKLTAVGIVAWISIQAFINISAMIGLLPLTGIPLPFISYGGSALITTLIGMGILLNISRETR